MKKTGGFTLVELMVVVAIIAILAGIGYPSYTAYVTRGKLVEGQSALSDGRVKMEQFFQDNRTYVGGPTPATTDSFTYSIGTPTATTYTLTATGKGGATGFTYTLNQNNEKKTTAAPSGWGPTSGTLPVSCWISKKGGQCN